MKAGEIDSKKTVQKDNVGRILHVPWTPATACCGSRPPGCRGRFLHPGKRIKLHPTTGTPWARTAAASTNAGSPPPPRPPTKAAPGDEGLSYCVFEGQRFLLRDAVAEAGRRLVGKAIWKKYQRWPVYSKFFDNMGPIPHHMHQSAKQAALVGQEGKPESYYFPPQLNNVDNNFPYTFFGLEPGTTKADSPPLPGKLEQGRQRHSRSLARPIASSPAPAG